MWRSILRVSVKGTELGLWKAGITCKLCSWAGFVNLKIQNRELQFARNVGANRSCHDKFDRWRSPVKHVEFYCQDKLSKIVIACFLPLLCHITVRRYVLLPTASGDDMFFAMHDRRQKTNFSLQIYLTCKKHAPRSDGRPTWISQFLTNFLWPKAITRTVLVMVRNLLIIRRL